MIDCRLSTVEVVYLLEGHCSLKVNFEACVYRVLLGFVG